MSTAESQRNPCRSVVAALLMGLACGSLQAQEGWPSRPIRVVVPSAAGGIIDVMCRLITDRLAQRLGRPIVVDNRPGASTIIGAQEVARAVPDGHTLLFTVMGATVSNRVLRSSLPYDPVRDFAPVTQVATGGVLFTGPANAPYKDLSGFVEWARKQGRPINYGSLGAGSALHLFGVILEREYNVPLNHVPYKVGTAMVNDVINGTLDVTFSNIPGIQPLVAAGKLRPLAIAGARRFSAMPDLRTFAEQGYPGFEMPVWTGVYVPARTPKAIIGRLATELIAVIRTPEVSEKMIAIGQIPIANTPEEFAENYRNDFPRWEAIIRASGARVD